MRLADRHHKYVKSPTLTPQVLPWRFRMIIRMCLSAIALLGFAISGYAVLDNLTTTRSPAHFTGDPELPSIGLISPHVPPEADWCGTGSVVYDGSSAYVGTVHLGYDADGACYLGWAYRFTNPPSCVVSERGARILSPSWTSTESGLIVMGMTPGGTFDYICVASGG